MRYYTFVIAESDTEAIETVIEDCADACDFDVTLSSQVGDTVLWVYTVSFSMRKEI